MVPLLASLLGLATPFNDVNIYPAINDYMPAPVHGEVEHPHMLRHTLASMALLHFRPAGDIAYLTKWLGHEKISTTYELYAHWSAPEAPSGYAHDYKITTAPIVPKKRKPQVQVNQTCG